MYFLSRDVFHLIWQYKSIITTKEKATHMHSSDFFSLILDFLHLCIILVLLFTEMQILLAPYNY